MFTLNQKSLDRLHGVAFDLVQVVKHAITITSVEFQVTEGVRSLERQKELYAARKSKTMNSRHLTGATSYDLAMDFRNGWSPLVRQVRVWAQCKELVEYRDRELIGDRSRVRVDQLTQSWPHCPCNRPLAAMPDGSPLARRAL